MKLILQKDVKNLGKVGDQVKVKKGYARNFLLPNKLALILNEDRLKDWKHKKAVIEIKKKQAVVDRQSLLKKVSAVEVCFEKESRAEGKLFGSVTAAEISNFLEKEHKILLDKKDFVMPEPLKNVGEYQITVALDSENKTELKVIVKQKISEKEEAAKKSKKGFFTKRFFSRDKNQEEPPVEGVQNKEEQPKQDSEENKKEKA